LGHKITTLKEADYIRSLSGFQFISENRKTPETQNKKEISDVKGNTKLLMADVLLTHQNYRLIEFY
jgi:hypothetical protein